jgi:hypothetical protein
LNVKAAATTGESDPDTSGLGEIGVLTDGGADADGPRNMQAAWAVEMPITRRRRVVLIRGMVDIEEDGLDMEGAMKK